MKWIVLCLMWCAFFQASAQQARLAGCVRREGGLPARGAEVSLTQGRLKRTASVGRNGRFEIAIPDTGTCHLVVFLPGYEVYEDSFPVHADSGGFYRPHGKDTCIYLVATAHMLDEVKIVQKALAVVQKEDTLEFNSAAYAVNPDADAADLVRKMPSIEINDKQIMAQGESVVKVLVDGKPFFGTDPYASLKNLPALVIDKVQVYNEKSDQEQFTGFNEGGTSKTINIVTRPDKRQGVFGKVYAGGGGGTDQALVSDGPDARYGTGLTLNEFSGDRRITLTGQSNNVNVQNFSDNNSQAGGSAGTTTTQAAGLDYSDKWGRKVDVSGSYYFNSDNTSYLRQLVRQFILPTDSGQVYTEQSSSLSQNLRHTANARLTWTIDSFNSIVWTPAINFSQHSGNNLTSGSTEQGVVPVNLTNDIGTNTANASGTSGTLLYRHRFRKKGRTFSASLIDNFSTSSGSSNRVDTNIYDFSPGLSDTLNQHAPQWQRNVSVSGSATWTEPAGKKGRLKFEYQASYQYARSDKNTFDLNPATHTYNLADSAYSSSFTNVTTAQKGGGSYQVELGRVECSAGLDYKLTQLQNRQTMPIAYQLSPGYQNFLPLAYIRYKISKTKSLVVNYNANTQEPSVILLQNVVNNTDPLHLYVGNPALAQSFRHAVTLRYNATTHESKNTFSASAGGVYTVHGITTASAIASKDSTVGNHIPLAAGSQISSPINVQPSASFNGSLGYSLPLPAIKCRLNLNLNSNYTHTPAYINGRLNYQVNATGGAGATLSSNISEYVDFLVSSYTSVVSNSNSLAGQSQSVYMFENARFSLNLLSKSGFLLNVLANWQTNSGIAAGYNADNVVCNVGVGKKMLAKKQLDIRLTVYDVFNQNNAIGHTITDAYIQDSRTNILKRYYLLTCTYKLNQFKAPKNGEVSPAKN